MIDWSIFHCLKKFSCIYTRPRLVNDGCGTRWRHACRPICVTICRLAISLTSARASLGMSRLKLRLSNTPTIRAEIRQHSGRNYCIAIQCASLLSTTTLLTYLLTQSLNGTAICTLRPLFVKLQDRATPRDFILILLDEDNATHWLSSGSQQTRKWYMDCRGTDLNALIILNYVEARKGIKCKVRAKHQARRRAIAAGEMQRALTTSRISFLKAPHQQHRSISLSDSEQQCSDEWPVVIARCHRDDQHHDDHQHSKPCCYTILCWTDSDRLSVSLCLP